MNYWVHGEWLLIGKEKMAKSSGNLVPLAVLMEKGYDPLDYRYFCLGAHYRTQLAFTWESLDAARTSRQGRDGKDRPDEGSVARRTRGAVRPAPVNTWTISRLTPRMT